MIEKLKRPHCYVGSIGEIFQAHEDKINELCEIAHTHEKRVSLKEAGDIANATSERLSGELEEERKRDSGCTCTPRKKCTKHACAECGARKKKFCSCKPFNPASVAHGVLKDKENGLCERCMSITGRAMLAKDCESLVKEIREEKDKRIGELEREARRLKSVLRRAYWSDSECSGCTKKDMIISKTLDI